MLLIQTMERMQTYCDCHRHRLCSRAADANVKPRIHALPESETRHGLVQQYDCFRAIQPTFELDESALSPRALAVRKLELFRRSSDDSTRDKKRAWTADVTRAAALAFSPRSLQGQSQFK